MTFVLTVGEVRGCSRSISCAYQLQVRFDKGVGSKPSFISNQNASSLATNEHPQALHISKLREQFKDCRNVTRTWCGEVVTSLANHILALVSDEVTKGIRNFDVSP